MKLVYLAGAVDFVDGGIARNWRTQAIEWLNDAGVATFSPAHAFSLSIMAPIDQALSNKVIDINESALRESDAVLAYCGAPSFGTPLELKVAEDHGIPIWVWSFPRESVYQFDYERRFESLSDACSSLVDWSIPTTTSPDE